MYAIKRVEAAQQDASKSEKRTTSAAATKENGENKRQSETNRKIEKRLTNPDRTPTDEEIQWLWNKVRACLDGPPTSAATSTAKDTQQHQQHEPKIIKSTGGSISNSGPSHLHHQVQSQEPR